MKTFKRGFTLIEILMVMSIIGILISYGMFKHTYFVKLQNRVDYKFCNNSILNIINNSKEYCRENKITGLLKFNKHNGTIVLSCSDIPIYRYSIPNNFKFTYINASDNIILIDNLGFTTSACTIKYLDRMEVEHVLSLCVGTAHVQIK
ncbi:type II secretion system protein [Clostridium peptidivorans]|uniref:type II secretion system protein n=1 Tax=Clostridium peptidivorans TaxID=100174 RepID=UPI000BE32787|nr:type II secretion system protein [Clostridium peptidivorans]